MNWERSNLEAAAAYLREMIEAGANDMRTRSVHEGLLDVLEPTRHATRIQRTVVADAAAEMMNDAADRRNDIDRRGRSDRRLINLGPLASGERRAGQGRRSGAERRNR